MAPMPEKILVYLHLATIIPAAAIGAFLLSMRKGTGLHRALGKAYMLLMLATAAITVFMPAAVGPQFLSHFGFIHLLVLLVVASVWRAYAAARRGNIRAHKAAMISLYVGGVLIAGGFALAPGRFLNNLLFG